MRRREFLGAFGSVTGAAVVTTLFEPLTLRRIQSAAQAVAGADPSVVARDETFWREVQQAFTVTRNLINLDNGWTCPSPRVVTDAMVRMSWKLQEAPALVLDDWESAHSLERVRRDLARLFGCDAEEIAITRNTTESLNIVLLGLELQRGDEVLTTTHDYWAMQDALEQRSAREGIVIKQIAVPAPARSLDALVQLFEQALTPKTRLILVTHPVNSTGQLFPIKRISDLAHARGIEVVVDGAQSFAHLDFKWADLGCDYFGASLHKWLMAPVGTGMLFVKKEKIPKIWPLFPAPREWRFNREDERGPTAGNIRKFEFQGTRPLPITLAINDAIAFHDALGPQRKEHRLRYLTRYWVERVRDLSNVRFLTSFDPGMSCGLATFEIDGVDSGQLVEHCYVRHQILVQQMRSRRAPEIRGIRVTPNVYTTLPELDAFVAAVRDVAEHGLKHG